MVVVVGYVDDSEGGDPDGEEAVAEDEVCQEERADKLRWSSFLVSTWRLLR